MNRCLVAVVACVLLTPAAAAASTARVVSADVCEADQFECNGFPGVWAPSKLTLAGRVLERATRPRRAGAI